MFPSQQPGQVLGEQGSVQFPLAQTSLTLWQSWQESPPLPHVLSFVPGRHTPPSGSATQQPLQFCGVHGIPGLHVPRQNSLDPQVWQAAPPWPHAVSDIPSRHTPPEQHPLGHVCGPHC